ncbi:D-hexose-6-phosphate mutarotase [Granulicoccus sp. GXG6511]|uniref:D-hexose-6-phosphate mutarotase n=1 Tax=Granulicoccus sp. GXG6511 TaxID=3381351 RepID=UPI003D7D8D9D
MFERTIDPDGWGRCQGITSTGGRFTVHDHGAHITEWTPTPGAEPVLWTSPTARFAPNVGIRGGIPICFPWFANGRKDNKSPAHGFARLATWQLLEGVERDGGTTLRWRLDETMIPKLDGIDPERNRFELEVTQVFGADLQVRLALRNTDDVPLVVEEALHTYLTVGDVRRVSVHGLAGTEYLDKLTKAYNTQIGPVGFDGEVDRIYWVKNPIEVHDPVLNRRLVLTTHRSDNTIVWNPWVDKTAEFADMPDDAWQSMVCVETANVRDRAVHLNPGQSHELSLTLTVADL